MTLYLNGTTGVSGVDGSAGTPSLQGNDTNTGIVFGTDTVGVVTGGVQRTTVDASGRLGINTNAPVYLLDVQTTSGNGIRYKSTSTGYGLYMGDNAGTPFVSTDSPSPLTFGVQNTERARIDSSGKLLVGTTTATGSSTFQVSGGCYLGTSNMYWYTSSNTFGTADGIYFGEGGRIFATRNTDAPFVGSRIGNDGPIAMWFRGASYVGNISVTGSGASYNTGSDYRLKENVAPITDGIFRLQQLKPSRFNFIVEPTKVVDGFLAHDVQPFVPESITGEKDAIDDNGNPIYQSIDQSKLVPLLTAALQEAIAKIEQLETRISNLEVTP